MRQKKLWFAMIGILTVLALMLPNGAGAESTYKVLHRFKGPDGAFPTASLIFDAAGSLYGTTSSGGTSEMGTVFKLTPNSDGTWKESVLYSFTGGTDGGTPVAGLIFDKAGNLYGTTRSGGQKGTLCETTCGLVFMLTPGSSGKWTESVVYAFHGPDGGNPYASVIFDAAGDLYGTTKNGGHATCACGTVFQLTPHSGGAWSETVLHNFSGFQGFGRKGFRLKGADGTLPQANLIFDVEGNLFGTAAEGGFFNHGMVFKLTPEGGGKWTETRIREFYGQEGHLPLAGLIFDAAGNLYGTTEWNGRFAPGLVFRLQPGLNKWTETVVYAFPRYVGAGHPEAPVIFDAAGNLYGTSSFQWGANGKVFKLAPGSNGQWTQTILHTFHRGGGVFPNSGLTFDDAGNLYGTATYGGNVKKCNGGCGVVYEVTP